MIKKLNEQELLAQWIKVLKENKPHASIRLGDSENVVAAHQEILTMSFINKVFHWINKAPKKCGVSLPNVKIREELIKALKKADFIGVSDNFKSWGLRPLSNMIFVYYNLKPQKIFPAFANFHLSKSPKFYQAFQNSKVLLVGVKAKQYQKVLKKRYKWTQIVGTVDCPSADYLEQAKLAMNKYNYDLALISAGVVACILAVHAQDTGHIGIDFGSGADVCIQADQDNMFAWEWGKNPKYGLQG